MVRRGMTPRNENKTQEKSSRIKPLLNNYKDIFLWDEDEIVNC